EDGRTVTGCATERMPPHWFDKHPQLTQERDFEQLREALPQTRGAYRSDSGPNSAWGHSARHYRAIHGTAARRGLPPLVASYGPALGDRAVCDAVCHALGTSCCAALSGNAAGLRPAGTSPAGARAGS